MINFNYKIDFELENLENIKKWISKCIKNYDRVEGNIEYIFCNDIFLNKINRQFLNHDTFTDIISFDYSKGKIISGDIFISIERVKENVEELNINYNTELQRVIIHGILHYIGYKDKSKDEKIEMRFQENSCLSLLE